MPYFKFGVHAAGVGGNYTGFGEYVAACKAAGVPCIVQAVDNAGPAQAVQALGRGMDVIVFRMTSKDGITLDRLPYSGDPVAFAHMRMDTIARYWPPELDRRKVWTVTVNEPSKEPGDIEWLAAFTLECGKIAIQTNTRHLACGWSMGTPEVDFWELPGTLDYLRLCSQHPDILGVSLHEYSGDDDITDNAPYFIGRFEFLHDVCDDYNIPYPPIVIGEFGWREASLRPSPGTFRQQLEWAQALYAPHDNILGAGIWTLGFWHGTVAADLAGHMPELAQMAAEYNYTPPEPPIDPPPDPPPGDCCDELRQRLDALEARVTALEATQPKPPPIEPPPVDDEPPVGIDISQWQVFIDWNLLGKAIDFAYIKLGSGATPTDPLFAQHWAGAGGKALRGAYWYLYPDNIMPAATQAQRFYNALPADCELPPMLDVEQDGLTRAMVAAFVAEFAAVSGGMTLGVYTSASKWSALTGGLDVRPAPLWVAHWTSAESPLLPKPWQSWVFWQHSNAGALPGYNGRLDLNRFNGGKLALAAYSQAWNRGGNPQPPEPPPAGETVDLTLYMTPAGDVGQFTVLSWLDGSRTQDQQLQRRDDSTITLVKGNDYERWAFSGGDLKRYEDTSMSADAAYTQNGARWLPRTVTIGQTYVNNPRITVRRKVDCAVLSDQTTTDYLTVAALHKSWRSPFGITLADVLEIHWRKSPGGPIQEVYFIAPRLAYVAWGEGEIEAAVSELPQGRPALPWRAWGCG